MSERVRNLVKAKQVKVTAKDIQEHIRRINEEMARTDVERQKYAEIRNAMQKIADKDCERFQKLQNEAKLYEGADAHYKELQEQLDREYVILKKYKDSKFYIAPKDLAIIGGVGILGLITICLERENPKMLKLATFVFKLFPIKM